MEEIVSIRAVDGVLAIQDNLKDYVDRGSALDNMNLLDFFLNTYDGAMTVPRMGGAGRPQSERVLYLEGTSHSNRCRVIRTDRHETMPNFVGQWFPRNNVPELQDVYHISMLALLTPWRDIGGLKMPSQTFKSAFDDFMASASRQTTDVIANIQYQYDCSDSALKKREQERQAAGAPVMSLDHDSFEELHNINEHEQGELRLDKSSTYSQSDIEREMASVFSPDDKLYAEVALNIAIDAGIFSEEPPQDITWNKLALPATRGQMVEFQALEKLVKEITKNKLPDDRRSDITIESGQGAHLLSYELPTIQPLQEPEAAFSHVANLYTEQLVAHNIVTNHLRAALAGRNPKQLLMSVTGQGGTGKSTMLNAITETFRKLGVSQLVKKTALSGVAASLIGGTTLHWFAGLPTQKIPQSDVWPDNSSKTMKDRRANNIRPIQYLAIDEAGMSTLDLVTLLSQVCGNVRADDSSASSITPFGGLNIILMSDFHQFPPVGNSNAALYCTPPNRNTAIVGKAIYLQFDTVINLTKQWRMDDPEWIAILQRLRSGDCSQSDLDEMRNLILTNPNCVIPDFTKAPWDEAVLITPRNSVRDAWNRLSIRKHCVKTANVLYIFDAEDTVGDRRDPLNMEQKVIVASMNLTDSKTANGTKKLTHRIELAVGMKVMVTLNLATEADLANGSRGIVTDIVLDPREDISMSDVDILSSG